MNLTDYIEQHCSKPSEALSQVERRTYLHNLNPRMVSGPVQGRLLSMLARMMKPRRILELGTFTGYSALCLAEAECPVLTIEHNDELEDDIRENLALSPYGKFVDLLIGDARQVIPKLEGWFDLIFIDADKRQYNEYLDLCLPKLSADGWILADNTLWDGHIIDPAYDKDPQTKALRLFNDRVTADSALESMILPIRDGVTMIRKRG